MRVTPWLNTLCSNSVCAHSQAVASQELYIDIDELYCFTIATVEQVMYRTINVPRGKNISEYCITRFFKLTKNVEKIKPTFYVH